MYHCRHCNAVSPVRLHLTKHKPSCPVFRNHLCNINGCMELLSPEHQLIHKRLFHRKTVAQRLDVPSTTTELPGYKAENDRQKAMKAKPPVDTKELAMPNSSINFPKMYAIENNVPQLRISEFMEHAKPAIHNCVATVLSKIPSIEYNIFLYVTLVEYKDHLFGSKFIAVESFSEIDDTIDVLTELITQATGSHKTFNGLYYIMVRKLVVNIRQLPIRIGTHIPLPKGMPKVINVKNSDNFCFKWAVLSAVVKRITGAHKNHLERTDYYRIGDITSDHIHQIYETQSVDLDFSNLKFPLEVRFCRIFEEKNPQFSVNVFSLEKTNPQHKKYIEPLYTTRCKKDFHINLLYIEDARGCQSHYAFIGDVSTLISK